jgi:hypothetical protein
MLLYLVDFEGSHIAVIVVQVRAYKHQQSFRVVRGLGSAQPYSELSVNSMKVLLSWIVHLHLLIKVRRCLGLLAYLVPAARLYDNLHPHLASFVL